MVAPAKQIAPDRHIARVRGEPTSRPGHLCLLCALGAALLFAVPRPAIASGPVVYVNAQAGQPGDGASWASAFARVGDALERAAAGTEVWVAAGVYRERIRLGSGVCLMGGFGGTETSSASRLIRQNETVLDGEGAGTVVTVEPGADQVTTIDGFTIRNGSGVKGGGVFARDASVRILNSTIVANLAEQGGGCYLERGAPFVACTVISANNASTSGGGIYVGGSDAAAVLTSNLMTENYAREGGAMYVSSSPVTLVNLTLVGNSADKGGAILMRSAQGSVRNSILAYNSSGLEAEAGAAIQFQHNCVFLNHDGDFRGIPDPTGATGNIRSDPGFVRLGRLDSDLRLSPSSACINAGDDSSIEPGWMDLDGASRIRGPHVEMGAYESDGAAGYRWWDAVQALRLAGGIRAATVQDAARLGLESRDTTRRVTLEDALRIARKASGRDPNP